MGKSSMFSLTHMSSRAHLPNPTLETLNHFRQANFQNHDAQVAKIYGTMDDLRLEHSRVQDCLLGFQLRFHFRVLYEVTAASTNCDLPLCRLLFCENKREACSLLVIPIQAIHLT